MKKAAKKKMGGRRRHTEHGEDQKQKLVDAAYDIIAELGFEGLHTRKIAARVGINVSTFHYYFPSKEDIVKAVAQKLLQEFKTQFDPGNGGGEGLGRIQDAVVAQEVLIKKNPASYIVVAEIFTRALRDVKIRSVMREISKTWERQFMASVVGVAGESRIAEGSDPELGARALHCLFWGMAMNQLMDVRGYPSVAVFGQFRKWLGRGG